MKTNLKVMAVLALLGLAAPASATETITYTYDALGRVIKVVHTGTVNSNLKVCYTLDAADNRTKVVTVTTTSNCTP
jgi:hypothetical protein